MIASVSRGNPGHHVRVVRSGRKEEGGAISSALSTMLAVGLLGISVPDIQAGSSALILDVPVEDGTSTFEVPAEWSGREVRLIVSTLGPSGPYPISWSSVSPSEAEPTLDVRSVGRRIRPIPAPDGVETDAVRYEADQVETEPTASPTSPPPLRRVFSVLVRPGDPASPSNYEAVPARLRALGHRVQVYVDESDLDRVGVEVLRDVVSSFDNQIEPILTTRLGRAEDIDGDGRFTVFFTSRLNGPFASRGHVDGYFRAADQDRSHAGILSNRADMVYLNATLEPGPYLRTVLAHEYAHAVIDSRRRAIGAVEVEESWLDEGEAHLAEDLVGLSRSNLDYRVSAFLNQPERYGLVVEDYARADLYRSHGSRGATYLFLRWCSDHIRPDLLEALSGSRWTGRENVERSTGLSFATLYQGWVVDLALSAPGGPWKSIGEASSSENGTDFDWPLAGVRFHDAPDPGATVHWKQAGTSSRFLRLSSDTDQPRRITIQSPHDAELQITAIRPSRSRIPPRFDVRLVDQDDAGAIVVLEVTGPHGRQSHIDSLSWEPVCPAPGHTRDEIRCGRLLDRDLAALMGSNAIRPGDRLVSQPLRIDGGLVDGSPLVFKLITTDDRGRSTASWAELDVNAVPPRSIAHR